ncbi:MAG: DUF5666 domain-containing protein [Pseudomonadota bacterium]
MRRLDRRIVLNGLGASTLGACAGPFRIGEGKKQPRGGIGGTGIIGTLTDFGSLILNGLRVELDSATEITDALGRAAEDSLAIGQNLTVEAATIDGALVARRVHITHPVIGQVDAAAQAGDQKLVDGVVVRPEPGMIGELAVGARVAVSGVWNGPEIIASRIDVVADEHPSVLAGVVNRPEGEQGAFVATRPLDLDSSLLPPQGSFVTLVWTGSGVDRFPTQIVPNRFTGAAGPLTGLSVEGYLDPIDAPPSYTLAGLGHSFDADAKLGAFRQGRALFTGGYDGDFVVQEGLPMPEDLTQRRARSLALLDGGPRGGLPVR